MRLCDLKGKTLEQLRQQERAEPKGGKREEQSIIDREKTQLCYAYAMGDCPHMLTLFATS